ncbi:glycosyltransferase family 2 protein [Robertkochia flava]|uniref:glycosyltransferase family 2 protein n=1 Tax=Robertkochia flava TaxID=3447986 RepID=UPI001CCE040A|nr:glycosyltransferase family 2 protein [Robertkochia marina]
MTEKQPISAVIITYNENGYIQQCIESLAFADEIIVVDSFSEDGTWEWISEQENITAVQHAFRNYTEQKSYALSLASHEWVYFLDADEQVPPALAMEICETTTLKDPFPAYWNYRTFMFKNQRLRFSGWQTDKVHRLFRKSECSFLQDRIVHETLSFEGDAGFLKEKLIHYSFKDYHDYKGKMLKYGRLRAIESYREGKKWYLFNQWFRPFWRFFYNFIFRLGFLDGRNGAIICYLNALGVYERYRELKRLRATS